MKHQQQIKARKVTLYPPQTNIYLSYATATCPVLPGGINISDPEKCPVLSEEFIGASINTDEINRLKKLEA